MTNLSSDDARVAELSRELDNLRSRQEAIADVLRALSRSGLRLQAILDRIVEAATRLCHADAGILYLAESELFHIQAACGVGAEAL